MATLNKQMKGFKSFYKSHDGARNVPTRDPVSMSSVDKVPIIYKYNWLGRKSKKATDQHGGRREAEGGVGGGEGRKVVIEGRKSVSHVETNMTSVATFLQVKVLVSDMPEMMQIQAFRSARRSYDSLEKFSSKHMAYNIKKEFDKVHGPAWHCIVGSSFGSFVTHSTGKQLYCYCSRSREDADTLYPETLLVAMADMSFHSDINDMEQTGVIHFKKKVRKPT